MSNPRRRKPYMPDSDVGKRAWMQRFIAQIERDPEHFGFDDPQMFEYVQRTIHTFIEAATVTAHKAGRSQEAVIRKNTARAEAVAICRDIAMRLKHDPTITDAELRSLGIRTDDAPAEDASLPGGLMPGTLGYPTLAVLRSPNGGHVIRYMDLTSKSKARPKGVSHLLLFGAIGEKPNMLRTHARLLGAYTKRPFEVHYPGCCGIEGKYVTYYARWLTTRGEMSPWSPPVSMVIGDARVSLRDCGFHHLFGEQGFIDALPDHSAADHATEVPALTGATEEMESSYRIMPPEALTWKAFALLESAVPAEDAEMRELRQVDAA